MQAWMMGLKTDDDDDGDDDDDNYDDYDHDDDDDDEKEVQFSALNTATINMKIPPFKSPYTAHRIG
jgi:hypothetical protein